MQNQTDAQVETIKNAKEIAIRALRQCYGEKGILAGRRHFDQYWARDSCFAILGADSIGDFSISRKNLELLIQNMRPDGQLPLRVGAANFVTHYLGKRLGFHPSMSEKPVFCDDKAQHKPTDQNSLFVIACLDYAEKSSDIGFLQTNFVAIKNALDWNLSQDADHDFLIEEAGYSGWADSLKKHGKVLYTNVCFGKAAADITRICQLLKKPREYTYYRRQAGLIKGRINEAFWKNDYYADFIAQYAWSGFSSDGNILAILWGIADKDKGLRIEKYIQTNGLEKQFALETSNKPYRKNDVSLAMRLAGLGDYHNGLIWLWPGCFDAAAKEMLGLKDEARFELSKIAAKIIEFDNIFEVYEKDGRPVNRLLYKSEVPFAWSSAAFIYACNALGI